MAWPSKREQSRQYARAGKLHSKGGSAPRRLPQVLNDDEVEALMAVPNLRAPTGLRNRVMLELMHRAGLRVGETCGLHMRDVRGNRLHLRAAITKGQKEAYAYIDEPMQEWIERWKFVRRRHAAGKAHLFTTLKGGPVSPKYVWEMMRRYARRAGIERPVHPHMLRHTFATDLIREGFNLRQVQELLRHSNIQTTSIYLHVYDPELERMAMNRAGARRPPGGNP
jgi:integrase/recombinase XerD